MDGCKKGVAIPGNELTIATSPGDTPPVGQAGTSANHLRYESGLMTTFEFRQM